VSGRDESDVVAASSKKMEGSTVINTANLASLVVFLVNFSKWRDWRDAQLPQ